MDAEYRTARLRTGDFRRRGYRSMKNAGIPGWACRRAWSMSIEVPLK